MKPHDVEKLVGFVADVSPCGLLDSGKVGDGRFYSSGPMFLFAVIFYNSELHKSMHDNIGEGVSCLRCGNGSAGQV